MRKGSLKAAFLTIHLTILLKYTNLYVEGGINPLQVFQTSLYINFN